MQCALMIYAEPGYHETLSEPDRAATLARRFVLCLPPTNQAPREHHERHPG